jgi:hypothetical protein
MKIRCCFLLLVVGLVGVACQSPHGGICTPQGSEERRIEGEGLAFLRRAPLGDICGPAYATMADLDGDGQDDLIVTGYGKSESEWTIPPGSISILDPKTGSTRRILHEDEDLKFPHRPLPWDVDDDGDIDLIVGMGFFPCTFVPFGQPCGGLVLLINDGTGHFSREDLVAPGDTRFFHGVDVGDVDHDGWPDLVTVAETRSAPWDPGGAEALLFSGKPGGFNREGRFIADGLGPFPQFFDVDNDGDLDVGGASFFGQKTGFHWLENRNGKFKSRAIDSEAGPAIQMTLSRDFLSGGEVVALGSNHVNQERSPDGPKPELALYRAPPDPSAAGAQWEKEILVDGFLPENRAGQLSPGIFGLGDISGEGLADVILSADGDPRVFAVLQKEGGDFVSVLLADDLPQAGGALIHDLDGDGDSDIVMTSYEKDAVVVFENLSEGESP